MRPEGIFHDEHNKISLPILPNLKDNINNVDLLLKNCGDKVARTIRIGKSNPLDIYILYIDGLVLRNVIEFSILEKIFALGDDALDLGGDSFTSLTQLFLDNIAGSVDIRESDSFDDLMRAALSGDTAIFVDGVAKGLILATKGWNNRGVQVPDNESVIRGPKEAFTESLRMNTALVRRRIRDTKLKIEQLSYGTRSRTDIALVYVDDIVKEGVVEQIKTRLCEYEIDVILDSGYIEQLIEDDWKSPFPQIQATQRPDKVASAVLEGRVGIIVDNSPFVLIVPATLNSFFSSIRRLLSEMGNYEFYKVTKIYNIILCSSSTGDIHCPP